MKGRLSYIIAVVLLIAAGGWVFVQSRDGGDGSESDGGSVKAPGGGAARPGGGTTPGGKTTKRDRPGGRVSRGRPAEGEGAAEPYLSEAEARQEATALVQDAMQLTDPAKRAEALNKIRAGLTGSDEKAAFVALLAFVGISDLKMNRAAFRDLVEPWLEAEVIELSRSADRSEMHDAVYFALSTSANKSSAAVDRLIEVLADPDVVNNAGRAAWGLRQGVADVDQGRVAEAAVSLLENRKSGPLWSQAVELLGRYGSAEHKGAIERLLADEGLDPRARMSLQKVLEQVGGRE